MVAIPFFPGTNCERDTLFAIKELGAQANLVWHKEDVLPLDTKLVIIPGGFSYGDYLRSGAIAHFSPIMQAIKEFAKNGGYVLGICNGFQILLESGLLPGAMKRNENLHFISDWISLTVANNDNAFLADCKVKDELYMPIAHAEGNYFCDDETLKTLTANNQIILTYKDGNINGATANIAGICDISKRIFGLMPHPERATNKILGGSDGAILLGAILQRSGCVS